MTSNTESYREKGRAVFLAAMMIMSIFAAGAVFAGSAAANDVTAGDDSGIDSPVYVGQQVALNDVSDDAVVDLLNRDGNSVSSQLESDNSVVFQTDGVSPGIYKFVDDGLAEDAQDPDWHQQNFEIVEQDLSASFTDSTLEEDSDDLSTLEIESDNRDLLTSMSKSVLTATTVVLLISWLMVPLVRITP
ncbi:surface glycoprotein [Natronoarchaeum sp. GCM10025703]|uniref:surface glycoprotein n=1 Tax=Natronoarchaeum sp. GCM10025703 TaxID=3252685 RepID=UPI00360F946F